MFTNSLKKIVNNRKKRVGRGAGSGKGMHTVGKGQKGQTSRSGYHEKRGFVGGAKPLNRILPVEKGVGKALLEENLSVSISKILDKKIFEIDTAVLSRFSKTENIKLVGAKDYSNYDLSKVVIKSGVSTSGSLKAKILASGGKVEE